MVAFFFWHGYCCCIHPDVKGEKKRLSAEESIMNFKFTLTRKHCQTHTDRKRVALLQSAQTRRVHFPHLDHVTHNVLVLFECPMPFLNHLILERACNITSDCKEQGGMVMYNYSYQCNLELGLGMVWRGSLSLLLPT